MPGMAILTAPGYAFHFTVSMGFNIAESCNMFLEMMGWTVQKLWDVSGTPWALPPGMGRCLQWHTLGMSFSSGARCQWLGVDGTLLSRMVELHGGIVPTVFPSSATRLLSLLGMGDVGAIPLVALLTWSLAADAWCMLCQPHPEAFAHGVSMNASMCLTCAPHGYYHVPLPAPHVLKVPRRRTHLNTIFSPCTHAGTPPGAVP